MRTVRHKSGVTEYVPTIEELKARRAEADEVAELARAIRALAERAASASAGEKRVLVPDKFLIEKRLERLDHGIRRLSQGIGKRLARSAAGAALVVAFLSAGIAMGQTATPTVTPTPTATPTFSMYSYGWNEPFRHWDEDRLKLTARIRAADAIGTEVVDARGTAVDLGTRIDVSLNPNGTIKESAAGALVSEWLLEGETISYASGTSFTVAGDQTEIYVAERRLKLHLASGDVYSRVYSSTYSAPDTTVVLPTSCIDATLDEARYSILSDDKSLPKFSSLEADDAEVTGTLTMSGTAKSPTGAVVGHVRVCTNADGTEGWSSPGAAVLVDDAATSAKIAEADGTSGQNTNIGSGIKRGHCQNGLIDQYKLDPGLLTGTSVGYGLVPMGAVMIWPVSRGAIPTGWHIMDGTGGTDDWRDRFIMSAGTTYAAGTTGGAATHTLTIAEIPSHNHTLSARNYIGGGSGTAAGITIGGASYVYSNTDVTAVKGGGGAHNNLPPYVVAYWIQKL